MFFIFDHFWPQEGAMLSVFGRPTRTEAEDDAEAARRPRAYGPFLGALANESPKRIVDRPFML